MIRWPRCRDANRRSAAAPAPVALLVVAVSLVPSGATPATPGASGAPTVSAPAAPTAPASSRVVARARFLMGARLAVEASGAEAADAIEAAFREVERLDRVLSNWRDDSELAALNREADGHPVVCSPDLYAVVALAIHWAELSDGAFDPTVEPLVRRLGLRGPEGRLPGAAPGTARPSPGHGVAPPAEDARPSVGWRHVRLDPDRRTIRFDAPGVGIDLGGIGKGYALDAALGVLVQRGVRSALLDFSGQLLVHGAGPDEGGWVVGVSGPEDRDRPRETLRLASGSIATSGNGERSVQGPGGTVGHILDPASARPAAFGGTVTVLARDGVSADALSTALFVMGPERGTAWAAAHDVEVVYLWVSDGGAPARSGTGRFVATPPAGKR